METRHHCLERLDEDLLCTEYSTEVLGRHPGQGDQPLTMYGPVRELGGAGTCNAAHRGLSLNVEILLITGSPPRGSDVLGRDTSKPCDHTYKEFPSSAEIQSQRRPVDVLDRNYVARS